MSFNPSNNVNIQDSAGNSIGSVGDALKVSVSGAGSGGTSSVDKNVFTAGVSAGTALMGIVAPGDTVPSGDLAIAALDAARNLKVNVVAGGAGGGASTVADGADVTLGITTDTAVVTDVNGTISGKLRGLVKMVASVISGGLVQIRALTTADAVTATIGTDSVGLAKEAGGNLATLAGAVTGGKVKVTPDSVALPAHQSVNVDQLGGSTLATNAGNSGTGTIRQVRSTAAVMNVGQVSIGSTATLILGSNANRMRLRATNFGTTDVFVGGSGVTTSTGQKIKGIDGYSWASYFSGAVYGIVASGTQTVGYDEESAS